MSTVLEKPKRGEYKRLLEFPEVKEWTDRLRTPKTLRLYLNGLNIFCKTLNITPEVLMQNTPEQNEVLYGQAFEQLLRKKPKRRVADIFTGVNSFLRFHNKKLDKPMYEGKDAYGRYVKKKKGERVFDWLLEYKCVTRWIKGYTSENTERGFLSEMNRFCKVAGTNPDKILEASEIEVLNMYTDVKNHYIQEGKSATAQRIFVMLRSFLDANRKAVTFSKRDRVKVEPKKVKVQHIPTKNEIYLMADNAGSVKNRAIILIMYQSGLRSNAIRKLTYDMVKNQLYPKLKVPIRLRITPDVDSKISKLGVGYYYAFVQDEAAESLKTYIDYRQQVEGWQPKDSDFVFVQEHRLNEEHREQKLNKDTINRMFKRVAEISGLDPKRVWAHLIRKSFRKILYQSPIDPDMAEAIMGHVIDGSKENYFDKKDIDWIAKEYMRCPFSREGIGRLDYLQKENIELKDKLDKLEDELGEIRDLLEKVSDITN